MLTKNLATNYRLNTGTSEGEGTETQSKLVVAAKWWLLSQLHE